MQKHPQIIKDESSSLEDAEQIKIQEEKNAAAAAEERRRRFSQTNCSYWRDRAPVILRDLYLI